MLTLLLSEAQFSKSFELAGLATQFTQISRAKQVATKGYSKVLTDSALQVNFFIHLHFFLKNAKTKVLSRPKPSVNMLRIHSGNTDGVNTSEIIIVTLCDLERRVDNIDPNE